METSRYLSLGDVLDQLLTDKLIDACHMTSEHVTVVQGTKRHSFPIDKAHTFLMGMLRGRSWNTGGDGAVPTLRPIHRFRSDSASPDADSPVVQPSGSRTDARRFDPALDELAAIAAEMGLVEECKRSRSDGLYRIKLSSCETEMRAEEAVAYLAECVLHRLTAMRGETTSES